jgi:hypothetical protein
MIGSFLF